MKALAQRLGLPRFGVVPTVARVSFAEVVAYRAEMVIWILSATLPLIMLGLWDAVVKDGAVAGFGQAEMTRYFAVTLLVRQLTGAWVFWVLNYEIRSGALSPKLLRPFHPLWYAALTMITAMPVRMVVLAPILAAVIAWRPELLAWPGLGHALLFVPAVLVAFAMSFLVQALFGMLAFWLDQSEGAFGLFFAVWSVASGYVAPLAVFPPQAQAWLVHLPFYGMMALPVEILGGFLPLEEALVRFAVQLFWALALWAVTALVWRRGIARYGAFGA